MTPISFSCKAHLAIAPTEIAEQILDISNWPDFKGYGPLPGIKSAEFEVKTPEVVGSRIRVQNTDRSLHVEEITEWLPESRVALRMQEFSAPLSWLATGIDETWEFEPVGGGTKVVRSFQLHTRSTMTRPLLWLISRLLKRAINRHLRQMSEHAPPQ
ncbi:MAG: SRPBCC family protein [Planctomycetota bacterium]